MITIIVPAWLVYATSIMVVISTAVSIFQIFTCKAYDRAVFDYLEILHNANKAQLQEYLKTHQRTRSHDADEHYCRSARPCGGER